MLKGIIFDLDGTLVDSLTATFEGFNRGFESQGARRMTPDEIAQYFGPGEPVIFSKVLNVPWDHPKVRNAMDVYAAYLSSEIGTLPLHPEVEELLAALKQAGIPVSIVTGRGWETTQKILNHHGIMDRFVTVIAHDHVAFPKPDPEGIRLALKRMKLEPTQAAYVGDSHLDMRASHGAGTHCIGALWDRIASREALSRENPHLLADSPLAILKYLGLRK